MDPSTYHDLMINLATNSPFLAWMIYSYTQTQKDLKETREQSRADNERLRQEARVEESEIRNRFEKVIADLTQDRKQIVDGFATRIDGVERGQKKLFAILEPMKEQILELKVKDKLKESGI